MAEIQLNLESRAIDESTTIYENCHKSQMQDEKFKLNLYNKKS